MNFLELVNKRQSCRAYDPLRPVENEKIERCLEAARLAPSACNAQPWKFVVVDEPGLKKKIATAADARFLGMNRFTKDSPILVVVVRESANFTSKLGTLLKDKPYPLMDVGIAVEHFCLQATSEGLGTCIMGWFDEKKVKELLGIPVRRRAELIVSVGYPATENLRKKIRKPLEEIRSYNQY